MARNYGKTKAQLVADGINRRKRLRMKARESIIYCSNKKCGYGWYKKEGETCPMCGSKPYDENATKETKRVSESRKAKLSMKRSRHTVSKGNHCGDDEK